LFVVIREGRRAPKCFLRIGWPGLVVALCYAIASTALTIAFSLTSVANTLVIMSSAPLVAAALAWLVLGERVRPVTLTAMFASMIGIGIMVTKSYASGSIAGDVAAGVIALAQAFAGVTIRRYRAVQTAPAMCISTFLTMLAVLPLASPLAVSAKELGSLTFFGAGQLGLGLALFSYGAPLIPVAEVALINVLEPIFGPFWVWLVLGEQPGKSALIGGVIVLAALTANFMIDTRRKPI
jgi:drug/metabolite transporter (DMT)-like permease